MASSDDMATIMVSNNGIAMIIVIPVINGVVVCPISVTPSMVILTSITIVGVTVRGGRMVVLTDITILRMLLSIYPLQRVSILPITL